MFFNIEFLRILFTMLVVVGHTANVLKIKEFAGSGGYLAVTFFFVLSGFLLNYTFNPERSIKSIMKKKYITWTPLIVFGGLLSGGGLKSFQALFYLQNTGLAAWSDIPNAPAWYLGVLFWVSLFYLALLKYTTKNSRNIILAFMIFISVMLTQQLSHYRRLDVVLSFIPVGLLKGFIEFGLGYFLAENINKLKIKQDIKTNSLTTYIWSVIEITSFTWIGILAIVPAWRIRTHIVIPCLMLCLIYSFIQKKGIFSRCLNRPIYKKLSSPCLSIYLTHWTLVKIFLPKWINNGYVQIYGNVITIITILLIAIILGIFSHFLIEKTFCYLFLKDLKTRKEKK